MTRPCGAALIQNRSVSLPQTSPAGVNARPTMQSKRAVGREQNLALVFWDDASIVPCARPVRLVSLIGFGRAFPVVCRAGDFARRLALRYDRTLRCGTYTKTQCFSAAKFPGGRERPPYNAGHTGGGPGTKGMAGG